MAINKIGPNKWQIKVSVRVSGKDDPVKKQEQFSGTKIEAELRKSEIIKDIKSVNSASCSLKLQQKRIENFSELVSAYRENLRIEGKLSAFHKSKIDFLEKELGQVLIPEFADVFFKYIKIFRNTPTIHGKVRSSASTNRLIEIVKAAFNHGIKIEAIEKNPITKARFPKSEEKARDRYLTIEERTKLLNAIREHRPYLLPFIEYSLAIPCRKSELVKAKREQYNQFTNTIYIPDSKNGKPINKPVPPSMKEYFRSIPIDCPYLFFRRDKNGGYHSLGNPKKAWRYCLKKAGIVNARVHDLRHIAATDLYSKNISERVIMDIAGWKTRMLSTYRHKDSLKSAQAINAFFEKTEQNNPSFEIASSS